MDNFSKQNVTTLSAMEALEMIYSSSVESNARLAEALEAMAAHRDIMVSEIQTLRQDLADMKQALTVLVKNNQSSPTLPLPVPPAQAEQIKTTDFKWDKRQDPDNPEEIFKNMHIRIPNR